MDALDLLLKRRSVPARNMVEPGPDAAALERILRAGTRVPDHGKLAPWRIQVLRKDGQRRLGETMAEIFARENAEANEAQIEAMRQKPALAPLLLVITHKPQPGKIPELEQILSGGALCQNILMAAHARAIAEAGSPAGRPSTRRSSSCWATTRPPTRSSASSISAPRPSRWRTARARRCPT